MFAVKLPDGREFLYEELPLTVIADAERLAGIEWFKLRPLTNLGHSIAIVTAVCRHAGVEPGSVLDGLTIKRFVEDPFVRLVSEDELALPTEYENGVPPEGGEQSTDGSASSPASPGAGPLT